MKKYTLIALFVVQSLLAVSQNNFEKEPYLVKSLSTETVKTVEVETSGGSIRVEGITTGEKRIEVYVTPNNYRNSDMTKEEVQQRMKEMYDLDITVVNNKLSAIAKPKEKITDWKKALNISFKIFVPVNVGTDLSTSGGSISLTNLVGELGFSTSGGSLNLEKVGGNVKGRTSGGSINVEDSKDQLDLRTSGGSIHARHCEGTMKLNTSGGSLDLSFLKGTIDAVTSGGSVNGSDIDGDLSAHTSGGNVMMNRLSCNLETSTSGGNIHIEMKELRKYVTINNSSGYVDLIVPSGKGVDLKLGADRIKTDKLVNFEGKVEEDEIKGKLNGGGTAVTVDARGSGRIYFGFTKS